MSQRLLLARRVLQRDVHAGGHVETEPWYGRPARPKRLTGRSLGQPETCSVAERSFPRASWPRPEPRCFDSGARQPSPVSTAPRRRARTIAAASPTGCAWRTACASVMTASARSHRAESTTASVDCAPPPAAHTAPATPIRASARASRDGRGARVPSRGAPPCAWGTACATRAAPSPRASVMRAFPAPTVPSKCARVTARGEAPASVAAAAACRASPGPTVSEGAAPTIAAATADACSRRPLCSPCAPMSRRRAHVLRGGKVPAAPSLAARIAALTTACAPRPARARVTTGGRVPRARA